MMTAFARCKMLANSSGSIKQTCSNFIPIKPKHLKHSRRALFMKNQSKKVKMRSLMPASLAAKASKKNKTAAQPAGHHHYFNLNTV